MNSELLDLYVKVLKNEMSALREKKAITTTRPIGQLTFWLVGLLDNGFTQEDIASLDKEYRKKAYEIIEKENPGLIKNLFN